MEFTDRDLMCAMAALSIAILLFFRHEHGIIDDLLDRRQISKVAYGTRARQLRAFCVGLILLLGFGAFIAFRFAKTT